MMLPAPCLFSTTIGWPSRSPSGGAMMRVMMSVPPPGPAPTMTWIGRVGQSCASAPAGTASARAAAASSVRINVIEGPLPARFAFLRLLFLIFDRIAQDADALDLDLARVAVLHPDRIGLARMADARRRAGEDDVARLERHPLRDEHQHLPHREHHVLGVVRLHDLAVEPALDLETLAGLRQRVGRDHPGAEAAGTVEVLAHVPLGGLALEFAHRALVRA